jgi:NSS family neurotransmitter:Na+ symporter
MAAREQWRSGLGFVLAAAGSAVGLGNLWGFAYRASQGGGAAFVVLYLLIVLLICLPVLVAELVMGRSTGNSPLLAPVQVGGGRWRALGWLFMLAACGILAFYAVLMGWTLVTLLQVAMAGLPSDISQAETFFAALSGGRGALVGQLLSMALTAVVVGAGVQGGIERLSRWGLPLLFLMLIGLAIWAGNLEGAGAGYRTFLLRWDSAQLLDPSTIRNAFTQAFFSIGTGIGTLLAYAAYLDRRAHLPREAVAVVGMDTAVGLLVALVFFLLAYLAAITSSVSLLEVPVASLMDALGWSRRRAVVLSSVLIFLLGLPAATSLGVLGWMDSVFGGVLLILGGLLLALLLGWAVPQHFRRDLLSSGTPEWVQRLLLVLLRWLAPPVVALGLVVSLVDLLGSWFG